ncbi:helix-turn-helix domain-containing protein [Puniceicoccales bacterium CK1056]|uniref:Helix-turn-helix domain-containing protein n=1 Tax=Oceanipulchritudo coccoides TaxID=2706888 RepID=A0A6B2M4A8_9BACT|nr:helix-turn-helix domain-containing protein [Oceanipulchritudo coccoides]NDV63132.1 helix-turn-helix domain-containing protein [Oceanipulchritudo coccoides]
MNENSSIKCTPFGLSVKQAALQINLSERTVRKLIEQGELRAVRIGRRVILRPKDLEDFMENNLV